ncbi:shikimate kinase, chloroplastic-like [Chenopodium quinoa]|nr:shikimate kinase, chloroplastic-like [Chenopodium quinoa]XP_021736643.1 shikimate kinase, chloroplastic-like [Chenopodium quinoa]XP_021737051.1 shikimate kinase, chloroplastic-like [Chenopodium quinoa]XP_021737052.1 shikimate kinase, chloroplastic-like [Chenopodium quinoa]
MEAKFLQCIQPCKWVDTEKLMRKPGGFILVSPKTMDDSGVRMMFMNVQSNRRTSVYHKPLRWQISSSLKNSQDSLLESSGISASLDESFVLKKKSAEVEPVLDGRCIYLVGMMGSGKTTIGRVLSEALNYSFSDSDLLLEDKVGGMSVAEIFKQHGEGFFRDKETEVLKELSMMHRRVISTGGGAVIRPINWKHMRSGISVWLDVPVDCLARRISAVGTGSRPLLHGESGDAYSKALTRLSTLLEERGEAYANANARVSLESIASKLGNVKVDNLSPVTIAIEVLEQIESFLKQ